MAVITTAIVQLLGGPSRRRWMTVASGAGATVPRALAVAGSDSEVTSRVVQVSW